MLAVWATTSTQRGQLDRMGRPLTGNALLAPLGGGRGERCAQGAVQRRPRREWAKLVPEIQETLGLYDGFDGVCGNQLLADRSAQPGCAIARWPNCSPTTGCGSTAHRGLQAVLRRRARALAGQAALRDDCGGRTPNHDAVDMYSSLLVNGTTTGVDDGVDRDEHEHSATGFPFLATPSNGAYHDH